MPTQVHVIDGKYIIIYNKYILNFKIINSKEEARRKKHIFKIINIYKYNLILKYSWALSILLISN